MPVKSILKYCGKDLPFEKDEKSDDIRGRMTDPDGSSCVKGPCGDTMEIYLLFTENRITSAKFETDGCGATSSCGAAVVRLALGKSLKDVFLMTPMEVLKASSSVGEDHLHCVLLSLNAFFSAIGDYLMKSGY